MSRRHLCPAGQGRGDVTLVVLPGGGPAGAFLAFAVAGAVGVALLATGRAHRDRPLPFGPAVRVIR